MSEQPPAIALFCDEAGKETDRYLAVGGIRITPQFATIARNNLTRLFAYHDIKSEVKWNKLDKGNRSKYQSIIDYCFGAIERQEMSFHCLLVDFQRFDHEARPDGNPGESLKRMYFQLMLHRCGKTHGRDHRCYAFPDKAKELKGLDLLKDGINSELRKKHGCQGSPFKAIEMRDSKEETLLQLNDLILGAVCYQKNLRFNAPDAGQPKANIAGYVLGRAGLAHYDSDTPKAQKGFTVWNLKSDLMKGGAKV